MVIGYVNINSKKVYSITISIILILFYFITQIMIQFIEFNFYKTIILTIQIPFYYTLLNIDDFHENINQYIQISTILVITILNFCIITNLVISKILSKKGAKKEVYFDSAYFINILFCRGYKNKFKLNQFIFMYPFTTPSSVYRSLWFFILFIFYTCFYNSFILITSCRYYF
jgi:hypothetical protein